jgi:solute carrier family 25 carnitine/acylcarnitine transporter 20/29
MAINAILFGVEEKVRHTLSPPPLSSTTSSKTKKQPCIEYYKLYAMSGAVAGFTQAFLLSPLELIKIKMQLPNSGYLNTWHCAHDLFTRRGYKFLTRGTMLTILRDVPAVSAYFVSFELACNSFSACRDNLAIFNLLVAGGVAGCVSWIVTYPIDVIKTRYQADTAYLGMRDCFRKTLRYEGYMGFWRGVAPTLLRAFPNNAAIFATVTLFNRILEGPKQESADTQSSVATNIANTKFLVELNDILR